MRGRWVLRRGVARAAVGGLAVGLAGLALLAIEESIATQSTTAHVRTFNDVTARWENISARIGAEHAALNDFLANNGNGFRRAPLVAAVNSAEPDFAWLIGHTNSAEASSAVMTRYQYIEYNRIVSGILDAADDGIALTGFGELASLAYARLSGQVVVNLQRRQQELEAYLHAVDRHNLQMRAVALVLVPFDLALWLACAVILIGYQRRAEWEAADQRHRALHDGLTGLPNRTLLLDRLSQTITRAGCHENWPFAVVFLDLNGFKIINDSLGHDVGDRVLIKVAERLTAAVPAGDTVSRFGGDEFVVLLSDVADVSSVETMVARILSVVSELLVIDEQELMIGAAAGIATGVTGHQTASEYLRDADIAMYRAKAAGNGSVVMFDPSMHVGAVKQLQLESDLRQALIGDQFELYYQPILRLRERRMVGMEALIRWRHPGRGMVNPSEFLPVAMTTGLIRDIGRWTIQTACSHIRAWLNAFPECADLTVSVNLSNRQFWAPELRSFVSQALADFDVPPAMLVFEVTEDVIMDNQDAASHLLRQLRDDGIRLHIDDFGTGYSSLAALHSFPVDALKIDRSFVRRMESDARSRELVRIMIAMGLNLGIEVIAEGIETEQEAAILAELGCPLVQGHLFSRPIRATEITCLFPASTPLEQVVV
jgi:diguanylate cyclase